MDVEFCSLAAIAPPPLVLVHSRFVHSSQGLSLAHCKTARCPCPAGSQQVHSQASVCSPIAKFPDGRSSSAPARVIVPGNRLLLPPTVSPTGRPVASYSATLLTSPLIGDQRGARPSHGEYVQHEG